MKAGLHEATNPRRWPLLSEDKIPRGNSKLIHKRQPRTWGGGTKNIRGKVAGGIRGGTVQRACGGVGRGEWCEGGRWRVLNLMVERVVLWEDKRIGGRFTCRAWGFKKVQQ